MEIGIFTTRMRVFLDGAHELFATYPDLKLPLSICDDGMVILVKKGKIVWSNVSYILVTLSIIKTSR